MRDTEMSEGSRGLESEDGGIEPVAARIRPQLDVARYQRLRGGYREGKRTRTWHLHRREPS